MADQLATNHFKQILFIEDEQFIAELYADVLNANGFTVTTIADGEAGLQAAQTNRYDLILLDLMLPNRPGIEILSMLRDQAVSPNFDQTTAIFVMTNFEEDDATKRQIMSMAQAYLIKVNTTPRSLVEFLQTGSFGPETATSPV